MNTQPDDLPVNDTGNEEIDPQPGDNTTLTEVLAGYEAEGFRAQFEIEAAGPADAAGVPAVRCVRCGRQSAPTEFAMHSMRRMEGASDPDDMLAIAAVTCPACQANGVLVLHFGAMATAEESDVLRALRDQRRDDVMPRASSPGEAVGDGSAT